MAQMRKCMQKVFVNNISSKNIQLLFIVLVKDEKRLRLEIGGGFPYFGWPLFLLNVEIDGTRSFFPQQTFWFLLVTSFLISCPYCCRQSSSDWRAVDLLDFRISEARA